MGRGKYGLTEVHLPDIADAASLFNEACNSIPRQGIIRCCFSSNVLSREHVFAANQIARSCCLPVIDCTGPVPVEISEDHSIVTESTSRVLFSKLRTSRYLSDSKNATNTFLAEVNSVSTESELFQILNSSLSSEALHSELGLHLIQSISYMDYYVQQGSKNRVILLIPHNPQLRNCCPIVRCSSQMLQEKRAYCCFSGCHLPQSPNL